MNNPHNRTSFGWMALGASVAVSACLAPKYTEGDPFGTPSGATAGATGNNAAGNASRASGGTNAPSTLQNKAGASGTVANGGTVASGGSAPVAGSSNLGGSNLGGTNVASTGSLAGATTGSAGFTNAGQSTGGAATGAAAGRANGGSTTAGTSSTGGALPSNGGALPSNGGAATGGKATTGGTATGGTTTGGAPATGGKATGGMPPTGGAPATGGVPPYNKPTITQEPQDSTVCLGTAASFSIAATGTGTPLTYQWYQLVASDSYKLGTGPSLTISTTPGMGSPTPPFSNNYYCVVTDTSGFSATSRTATLSVPNPPAYNIWNWGIDSESTAVPHLWVQLDPPASGCIHYVYSNNGTGFTILQTGVCAGGGQAWPNVGMPPDYATVSNNIVQVISVEGNSGLACETRSTWVWDGSIP